jgi:hypothetical protein
MGMGRVGPGRAGPGQARQGRATPYDTIESPGVSGWEKNNFGRTDLVAGGFLFLFRNSIS